MNEKLEKEIIAYSKNWFDERNSIEPIKKIMDKYLNYGQIEFLDDEVICLLMDLLDKHSAFDKIDKVNMEAFIFNYVLFEDRSNRDSANVTAGIVRWALRTLYCACKET